ncbi:MAG: DUF167 family protein [Patescibacteria group bacterium]|nr:DUF167 family protein [Patescibacteria group bacterium]
MKISVQVHTRSNKSEVAKKREGEYDIYTTKLPQKDAANKAIIKLLAEYFDVTQSCVLINKGRISNKKIIEIIQ